MEENEEKKLIKQAVQHLGERKQFDKFIDLDLDFVRYIVTTKKLDLEELFSSMPFLV